MRSPLIAVVLCIVANAAAAQCLAPASTDAKNTGGVIKASAPAAPTAGTRGELIKAAAAGTRDEPGSRQGAPIARTQQSHLQGDTQEHPRRGGLAMLLAALALMSAIALRRFGSLPQ